MLKVLSRPQFTLFTSVLTRSLSGDSGLPKFRDVSDSLLDNIKSHGSGHYVQLTGQYYDLDPTLTRNIVLKVGNDLGKNFKPITIMDAALSMQESKTLTDILVDSHECRFLSTGEVDSVGLNDWSYGYMLNPYFAIFTPDSLILHQSTENRSLLQLHPRKECSMAHKVWMKDVRTVFVDFKDRPWSTQTLGFRLVGDQMDILTHENDFLSNYDPDLSEPSREELGEVMLNTEWLIKTAAQLVHVLRVNGNNRKISLLIPKVVQADQNPWVELRNSIWSDQVSVKLEKSKGSYIP